MDPKTKLIFLTKCLMLLSWIQKISSEEVESQRLIVELEMDDLELVDICENIGHAKKTAYLVQNYEDKIREEQVYGSIIKAHYKVLKEFTDLPREIEKNFTYQVKAGNALLPEEKWNKLVLYTNRIEEISNHIKIFPLNTTDPTPVTKSDYKNILKNSRNINNQKSAWSGWQDIYNVSDVEAFPSHLQLIKEAAILNEFDSVQDYWETLNEFQGAYSHADQFWEEISPFYNRLVGFVRTRLFKYYNISQSDGEIPVYLLGHPLGSDWSNIADIILPHPQLHYDVESYLKFKNVQEIYKFSENTVRSVGLGSLGNKFWGSSFFNASTCGPEFFEFCDSEYTAIAECNTPSWKGYLDAHEASLRVALNNMDHRGLTRQKLRFSSINSAVETLGSLLAIESLPYHGILNQNVFENEDNSANMTKLLLTALRVMPRLSYYLMADKWRLAEVEQSGTSIAERYWNFRKQYNGVKGETNEEPEYLEDSYILANKPYISKFFGTLVAFQLYEYYEGLSENSTNLIEDFGKDDNLKMMIREQFTDTDWLYLLTLQYGLEEIGTAGILKYFEPLEQYLETAPLEQVPVVVTTTTTSTSTTTTSKPSTGFKLLANNGTNDVVLSDQPKLNATILGINSDSGPIKDSHVAMWVGVSLAVLVGCMLVAGFGYKTLRRKRRRANNRRFDT